MCVPTSTSVLTVLTQAPLGELARSLGVSIPSSGRKDVQVARLLHAARLPLPALLGHLYRDELRAACREHDLTAESRSRDELAGRLLDAAGLPRSRDTIPPLFATTTSGDTPNAGDVVMVRRRNYLVDRVHPPVNADDATRVALICLDDDNQGRRTEALWQLELTLLSLLDRQRFTRGVSPSGCLLEQIMVRRRARPAGRPESWGRLQLPGTVRHLQKLRGADKFGGFRGKQSSGRCLQGREHGQRRHPPAAREHPRPGPDPAAPAGHRALARHRGDPTRARPRERV
jgi:hypothetical protein